MQKNLWTERAKAATQYCLTAYWNEQAGRFRPAAPVDPKALPWDFMWANGVAFSMLVGANDKPRTARFFDGLQGYWDTRAIVPGYDAYLSSPGNSDKYYDDNAWMVITFVEAYEKTGERKYLTRAAETMRFVLSGWDEKLGGGIYWKEDKKTKNTCSNGPSATAALVLARHFNPGYFVPYARRILVWTKEKLQAPNGLYWDNCDLTGKIEKTQWTYNTALMLRGHLLLYRATGDKSQLDEAVRLAEASEKGLVDPATGAFKDEPNFSHLLTEAFLDLHKETKAAYLRKRAEAYGEFCWNRLRDPADGGHWTRRPGEDRKTLMSNGSVARTYWLLANHNS